jgi:hypothetical protein
MMNAMQTPRTRAEFERNFHLLRRQIEDGRFHVPSDFRSLESLARLRFLPNGRMDFLSVDEMARMQANMMAQFSEESFQEQLKAQAGPANPSNEGNGQPQDLPSDEPPI